MRWAANEIPIVRQWLDRAGRRHRLLADAAISSGTVTLNRPYLDGVRFDKLGIGQTNMFEQTFFEEVRVAPPDLVGDVLRYAEDPGAWRAKRPLIPALRAKLEESWNPDAFHLCWHSSGYDSRILSGILAQLRDKHGEGWIGDILFVCLEPEGRYFKPIMKWEGWHPGQYHVYREGVGVDYRAELVDFADAWRWVQTYSIPYMTCGPAIAEAAARGLIPPGREIHTLAGMFGNELEKMNNALVNGRGTVFQDGLIPGNKLYPNPLVSQLVARWYWRLYTSTALNVMGGRLSTPYTDTRIASSVRNRRSAVQELSTRLFSFPKQPDGPLNTWPNWLGPDGRLSEATRRRAAAAFSGSEYAKETGQPRLEVAPELPDPWWRGYVLASFCQYVTRMGAKIDWR